MAPKPTTTPRSVAGYKARYCEDVVEFMAKGYSLTAFAGEIGQTRATLTRWRQAHPNFAEAIERAQARRARVLEDKMLAAKGSSAFGVHMQALKTAAPEEWTDAKAVAGRGHAREPLAVKVDVMLPDNDRD